MKIICTHVVVLSLVFATATTAEPSRTLLKRQAASPSYSYDAPGAIAEAVFTFRENEALYIFGGGNKSTGSAFARRRKFYKLDLSTPWTASDPAWTELPVPLEWKSMTLGNFGARIVLSKDGSAVFCDALTMRPYLTRTKQWMPSIDFSGISMPSNFHLGAIAHGDSGIIYNLENYGNNRCWVSVFDPSKGKLESVRFTNEFCAEDISWNANVGAYLAARKSIYYLKSPPRLYLKAEKAEIQEFTGDASLSLVNTTGDVPDARTGPCFAAAYGGSKIILLGGGKQMPKPANESLPTEDITLKDVYMLDVATSAWTKLTDAPSTYYKPVCAVSGDYLIVYGGYSAHPVGNHFYGLVDGIVVTNGNPPSILDLKNNAWVTEYRPSVSTSSSSSLVGQSMSLGYYSIVLGSIASIVSLF